MKKHGRCVDISKDHLKHSGRNFNSGHSTVLCTCIHVILNKDVHQKKKKKYKTYQTADITCFLCKNVGLISEKSLFIKKTITIWREVHYPMLTPWKIVTERHNLIAGGHFWWQLLTSFLWFQDQTYSPYGRGVQPAACRPNAALPDLGVRPAWDLKKKFNCPES